MFLKRRKTKSYTPITLGLSKTDADRLKKNIRPSFHAFKNNLQNITDWHNLGFRLRVAVEVARDLYVEENVQALQKCLDVIINLKPVYLATKRLPVTPEELELIEMGLDAMDEMQDHASRRMLLDKFLEADKFMKQLSDYRP